MVTGILLERREAISKGVLTLQVNQQIEVNVTADEAQRKVSVFVLKEIGNLLHGAAPTLVLRQAQDALRQAEDAVAGERIVWRVPVHLTRPSYGDLGQVGYIDVDVTSGDLIFTPETVPSIERNAQNLVDRLAPQAAPAVG
jgi:hypothetical protein